MEAKEAALLPYGAKVKLVKGISEYEKSLIASGVVEFRFRGLTGTQGYARCEWSDGTMSYLHPEGLEVDRWGAAFEEVVE